MDFSTRIEVQVATQQWVASFMKQYNIPAAMMEDAITKVLCDLKDSVLAEFVIAAQNQNEKESINE